MRALALPQALFGDELFTYAIALRPGIGDAFDEILATENTPPLYYLLAWPLAQIGDAATAVRLPAVLAGATTVPVAILVGQRLAGLRAGIAAGMLLALWPFAVFYSSEARAYSTAGLLALLSFLLLLRALETRRRLDWAAHAAAACLAVLAHLTAVFVIAAAACWALWRVRDARRPVFVCGLAVVATLAAWLPGIARQADNPGREVLASYAPVTAETVVKAPATAVLGHPFVPLRDFPGTVLLALMMAALLVLAAGPLLRRRDPASRSLLEPLALAAALAAATPAGALVVSVLGDSIWLPRNLYVALPFLAVALGVAAAALRPRVAAAAVGVLLAVFAVGTWRTLGPDRRPPMDAAAETINAATRPGDAVLQTSYGLAVGPLAEDLRRTLDVPAALRFAGPDLSAPDGFWEARAPGSRVFLVGPVVDGVVVGPAPPRRYVHERSERHEGLIDIEVAVYRAER